MKEKRYVVFLALIIGLIFSLISGASAVFAQESVDEEFTLEEITVTAQKRAENQQKVPITMEVISGEEIKEMSRNSLDEILTNVSSAIIQKAGDGYRVSIRGISDDAGTFYGQSQSNPSVAINLDGIYSNRKDTGTSLFDVERVEVLYGPQSTLYSSNSPGGIVNVVTAAPKTDKFEISGSLEAGNYGLLHTEGAVNVPVTDTTALRASFSTSKRDGYLSGGGGDNEDTKSARLRALFEPSDRLSMLLTGEYSKNKGSGFGSGVWVFDYEDGVWQGGRGTDVPENTPVTDPWTAQSDDSLAENDEDSYRVFLNMDMDLGFASLSLVPAYAKREGKNVMNFMTEYRYQESLISEKSVELRMASSSDFFFKWIFGVSYLKSNNSNNHENALYHAGYGTDEGGEYSIRIFKETAKAVFGNATYPVTDTFRLTAGIRKSWDDMDSYAEEYKQGGQMPNLGGGQSAPSRPDIKVGLEYDLGANSMLYGDYATSYRIQAMTEQRDPQELKAYSLGVKNRFFGNKLQLNVGAYYYDYQNYGVQYREEVWIADYDGDFLPPTAGGPPPPPGGGGTLRETTMDEGSRDKVADGRMYGIDLSSSFLFTSKDLLNLSVSWIKSEWYDLYFNWEYEQQLSTVYDENGTPIGVEWVDHPDMDYSGKPMTNTPPWTINLNYTHNFTLWNGGTLKPGVSVKYQTGYNLSWNDDNYPWNHQETHHMLNASMVYNSPGGRWNLSAYVNNIGNYAEKRQYMEVAGRGRLSIGDPRTFGATLSVKF